MLARVLERGADDVIVDLEDAVPAAGKPAARRVLREWLDSLDTLHTSTTGIWVRVNPGAALLDDLDALAGSSRVAGVVLAKAQSYADVLELDAALRERASDALVMPLLESAKAIANAPHIATAPRVTRLQVGEVDLQADVGTLPSAEETESLFPRSAVVFASAAAGIAPPIGPVSTEVRDMEWFRRSTRALARLGFVGRACIHPNQVEVANEVFTPTESEIGAARALLERFSEGIGVDDSGRFVDEAVLRRARTLLDRASPPVG